MHGIYLKTNKQKNKDQPQIPTGFGKQSHYECL